MVNFWEAWATSKDADNMLAMLYTWQAGDVSAQEPYNGMRASATVGAPKALTSSGIGDFDAAMKGIKAKALVLPGKTDLYFRECGTRGLNHDIGRHWEPPNPREP
jgi:homoserine O-acetyltransferase